MSRIKLFVVYLLAVPGCGMAGENQYPEEVRANYIEACAARGVQENNCECSLRGLEDKLTYAEFEKLDQAIRDGDAGASEKLQTLMQAIWRDCEV